MPGGLKGLLILGKGKKGPMPADDDDEAPASGTASGIEDEYFAKAFSAVKAGNADAFARFMKRGIEACVEKANGGGYEEGE